MFSRKILELYNAYSLKWAKLRIFRRNFKNEISRWVGNFYNWIFPTLFFRAVKTIPCSPSCTLKYKPLFCYSIWFNTGETYRFSMHKSTIVDINIFWPRPYLVILDSQPLKRVTSQHIWLKLTNYFRCLDVPFAICDCTTLTMAGWVPSINLELDFFF